MNLCVFFFLLLFFLVAFFFFFSSHEFVIVVHILSTKSSPLVLPTLQVVSRSTLEAIHVPLPGKSLLAVAAFYEGKDGQPVRLIDNVEL